ncbi:MAG: hypothetical protein GKR88_11415 [Flavobacteriaceae bacterium]|nr:MAG: hypothetical protein GKR88_11415 [Flavobacteriaceae bacterium]
MKKIIYLLVFMFSISLSAANSIDVKEEVDNNKDVKIIKVDKKLSKDGTVLFVNYTGVCRDGHRFNFSAPDRDTAQEFVNSYCQFRRDYQIRDAEN